MTTSTAVFTVILPHKRNPGNDAALRIALDMLLANTASDFILMMDAAYDAPLYSRIDSMVRAASTPICVFTNSDMFMSPGWDAPMLDCIDSRTFVTNTLVEPGAIGIHHMNVCHDFGRKPEQFNRPAFETWSKTAAAPGGEGWYAPYMFPRDGYLAYGGLELYAPSTQHGAWTTSDIDLFERWKAGGNRVVRAPNSFTYHLQRYSDVEEQQHNKREAK